MRRRLAHRFAWRVSMGFGEYGYYLPCLCRYFYIDRLFQKTLTPSSRLSGGRCAVESILLANSAATPFYADLVLIGSGAKVYTAMTAAYLTDQKPEALRLRACEQPSHNRRSPCHRRDPTKGIFSTLLKLIPAKVGSPDFYQRQSGLRRKGITIAVLDTGVGWTTALRKPTEGKIKSGDFQDFSGQGHFLELGQSVNIISFSGLGGIEYYIEGCGPLEPKLHRSASHAATNGIDIPTETLKTWGDRTKGTELFGHVLIPITIESLVTKECGTHNYAESPASCKTHGRRIAETYSQHQQHIGSICLSPSLLTRRLLTERMFTGVPPATRRATSRRRNTAGAQKLSLKVATIGSPVDRHDRISNRHQLRSQTVCQVINIGIRAGSVTGKAPWLTVRR
ncbi:MAG: hypothetical protein H6617_03365 [Bdellovibrionaceae bacterium]|nr:hypothetical protein [Pseudobdellovibrionaceae bacterium]